MIEKVLTYQETDGKIRQIEKQLNDSESKKRGRQFSAYLRDAEAAFKKMEQRSKELNIMLNGLTQSFDEKVKLVTEYEKNVDTSRDLEEINYLRKKIDDLAKVLMSVDKDVKGILQEIEEISKQYDSYRDKYPMARKQYLECKENYEKEKQARVPELNELQKSLKKIEKTLDPEMLDTYQKIKGQGIYPPFVPLVGSNQCGGCQMEIPSGIVANIDQKGYIKCDNCRRIVYKTKV